MIPVEPMGSCLGSTKKKINYGSENFCIPKIWVFWVFEGGKFPTKNDGYYGYFPKIRGSAKAKLGQTYCQSSKLRTSHHIAVSLAASNLRWRTIL